MDGYEEIDGMTVEVEEPLAGVMVARFHGPLDLATAPVLASEMRRRLAASPPRRLVMDMAGVPFVGCRGVGFLVELARWAENRPGTERACLIGLHPHSRRVLELVSVLDHFDVLDQDAPRRADISSLRSGAERDRAPARERDEISR